ncbi:MULTISPECIES: MFS transporter [Winogradskyella]|uniref:MFS transporter n=1 Tax=Winogradskyella TaxID=286104 RepID=UPI001FEB2ACD|nr:MULTISPECIES: MFS transporter [Winogradskyella]
MEVTKKVSMGKKIAFGLGMLANQMFPAALGIFMVVLVKDLGFPTWMWGVLYFLPRIFDSITDPIMGFISDNTKSRWGRRRHYVFIGAIIMGISFAFMWQLHRENTLDYNFWYYLIWSLIFYLGLTIFSVPYVAMGYEMSDDFHERTSIMAVSQWIGQWAWVLAPWLWVVMYDPAWFESGDVATRTLAIWVAVICALLAMVPALFIKDESTLHDDSLVPLTIRNIGSSLNQIVTGFKEAFRIVQFRKLCISTFFIYNAFNTVAAFSFFIIVYYLFDGDAGKAWIWPTLFGSVGALVTTFMVIPVVAKLSKTLGKKNAFLISQGISIVGYILLWFLFVPGKPYLFLIALPFFSFGIGGLFTIMMSMTADVCDLDELNFGHRREGIFGAIYWWMVKFGFAIAGGLSGLIMYLVDFTPDALTQPEGAVEGLRFFFSALPILGTAIAMYVMRDYDLTEERSLEIKQELNNRKIKKKINAFVSPYEVNGDNMASILNNEIHLKAYKAIDFTDKTVEDLKSLYRNTLNHKLHGLCFSPYVEGQNTDDILSESQIKRRMGIITPYTTWIRSFSCTEGNELIPKVAHNKGLKSMVGAWISNDKDRNEREIKRLVTLAKEGYVDIVVVGNEVLLRNEISEDELIAYINRVRKELSGFNNVQIGYADTYYEYYKHPRLVDAVDVVLANCYPFWEGYSIEDAFQHLRQMYAITQIVAKDKKVIITETGWPSQGQTVEDAHPSQVNAMKYFVQTQEWAKKEGIDIFHFSSFDESWKIGTEGDVGASWGIWNKKEKRKV